MDTPNLDGATITIDGIEYKLTQITHEEGDIYDAEPTETVGYTIFDMMW